MERVAFLVESTGQKIDCLLNPESVVVRREAGVQQRRLPGGPLIGAAVSDTPLIHVGGGMTEIDLDLLFDVSLLSGETAVVDVRELTKPLWDLAENETIDSISSILPFVWFVWGKYWRIFGVISTIAERLEHFTSEGIPRRSWLRMRMLRTPEPKIETDEATLPLPLRPDEVDSNFNGNILQDYQFSGGGGNRDLNVRDSAVRLDVTAFELTGHAELWRWLVPSNIENPLEMQVSETDFLVPRSIKSGEYE